MRRYEHRQRGLAIGLAILAGFVDALGFLKLGGLFVSFMSGNSTRMAVGLVGARQGSLLAGALIAAFVAGVMLGMCVATRSGPWRKQAVLALVVLLLVLAASLVTHGDRIMLPTLLMAATMGAANAVFQRDGEVSVGVTYMTGTLVKLGQHLVAALCGGPRFGWVPFALLWLGLVGGAMAGAAVFARMELDGLRVAVGFATVLLAGAIALGPTREP